MPSLSRFPSRDTFLDSANPATNQGSNTGVNNGFLAAKVNTLYHGLYLFDFSALVGFGVSVVTASFQYYVNSTAGAGGAQHALHRITQQAWTEMGATWNTYDGVNAWVTAGGDYSPGPPGPFLWTPPASGGPQAIVGDTSFIALVQDAIDVQGGMLHLLWKQNVEAAANAITVAIASKEDINQPPSHWPIIQIQYTQPAAKQQTRILNVTGDMPEVDLDAVSKNQFVDWYD